MTNYVRIHLTGHNLSIEIQFTSYEPDKVRGKLDLSPFCVQKLLDTYPGASPRDPSPTLSILLP